MSLFECLFWAAWFMVVYYLGKRAFKYARAERELMEKNDADRDRPRR